MRKDANLMLPAEETRPISLKNNVIVQELDKELLLYDLGRDKAFCLNETSLLIWNLCDGENSVEDIRRKVSTKLKTHINEEMIWLALRSLKDEQLLSNHQEIEINFNGLSRREAIRKVGLTTMAALPLITAIISPLPAAAQSRLVCSSSTICFCEDPTCTRLGDSALLQSPCTSQNCSTGGTNCQCVGRFFCSTTSGVRFGMCGLV